MNEVNFKKLVFRETKLPFGTIEHRAKIMVKGIFGIRFYYKLNRFQSDSSRLYSYGWVINGKWEGRKSSIETLFCSTEEGCIKKCQEKYEEICSKILSEIINDKGEN